MEAQLDVFYFPRKRTDFIRFCYDEGLKPFLDLKRGIEVG